MLYKKTNITIAVIDGKEVEYDVASEARDLERSKRFYGPDYKYIGRGYILSVDGVNQGYPKIDNHYFFKRV